MIAKHTVHQVIVGSMMWTGCGQAGQGPSDLTPPPDMVMSDGGASAVSVTVRPNQNIAGFPHAIDMYVPSNATIAVLFMHGGGGHKEPFAADLGIKNDTSTTNYELTINGKTWLAAQGVLAIFPQGQTLPGYQAFTWRNYVMESGQDDVAFVQALVAAVKADATLPRVSKFYLVGHSNGGMLANRMWCESPSTFDGFGGLAGPPSVHLDPAVMASSTDHPCQPAVVKPYIGIVGNADTVLQTTGNLGKAVWITNPVLHLGNPPTWVDSTPSVLNDELFHSTRVTMKCAGQPGAPTTSGQLKTYLDCGGSLKFIEVAQSTSSGSPVGGDHCLTRLSGPCVTTLAGNTGLDYKAEVVSFLRAF